MTPVCLHASQMLSRTGLATIICQIIDWQHRTTTDGGFLQKKEEKKRLRKEANEKKKQRKEDSYVHRTLLSESTLATCSVSCDVATRTEQNAC